ncbi:MAG: glycosyltransferase, partial [Pseudomonadota bacterium]|nr:glycosyltransferase [Pseudomonadota bacterium]
MSEQPAVVVVIVNYNSGPCLRRCLDSLALSDIPLRAVVVDNASSDDSMAGIGNGRLGEHPLQVVCNDQNLGFAAAVNQGAGLAGGGKYLLLLNPDCVVHPRTVRGLAETLAASPQAAITGALVFNEDGSEQRGCRRREPTLARSAARSLGLTRWFEGVEMTGEPLPSGARAVDAVSGAAMLVRRETFDAIGGMDTAYFLHCEDLDICRVMRDRGRRVLFVPGVSLFHRQGVSGCATPLRIEWLKHSGMLRYYDKHERQRHGVVYGFVSRLLVLGRFGAVSVIHLARRFSPFGKTDRDSTACDSPIAPRQGRTRVLVTGATSEVGQSLLPRLKAAGYDCLAATRGDLPQQDESRIHWYRWDYFTKAPAADLGPIDYWINLAPLWTTRKLWETVSRFGVRRLVAVGSTSVLGKARSDNPREQLVVGKLREAENWLLQSAETQGLNSTLFRASMLYGGGKNQNVHFIASTVRRFGWFPLLHEGCGKRQPVHADDVASACVAVLEKPGTVGKVYTLSGGEILAYREMVERVFVQQGRKPRFVNLPAGLFHFLLRVFSGLPGLGFLTPEMADRMRQDLVYDHGDA